MRSWMRSPRPRPGRVADPSKATARHHGFTLVELLTVVAILSALAALLLPMMRRARQAANQVVCASTQHQLFTSLYAYSGEHAGFLPMPQLYVGEGVGCINLIPSGLRVPTGLARLYPTYTDTSLLFWCPDSVASMNTSQPPKPCSTYEKDFLKKLSTGGKYSYSSYAFRSRLGYDPVGSYYFRARRQSDQYELPGVLNNCGSGNRVTGGPWAMIECGTCYYYQSNWNQVWCHQDRGINVLCGNGSSRWREGMTQRRTWMPPSFESMEQDN